MNKKTLVITLLFILISSFVFGDKDEDFLLAVKKGNLDAVKKVLIYQKAWKYYKDKYGRQAHHIAAQMGYTDILEYLIKIGLQVNAVDDMNWTPLHCAAHTGQLSSVELLLKYKAKIDPEANVGETPLLLAAYKGNINVFKYLIEKGARTDVKDIQGNSLLHAAAYSGEFEIVKYIVEDMEFDINSENVYGWTPLHRAAYAGNLEVVKYLIEKGADIEKKTTTAWKKYDENITALEVSKIKKNEKVEEYLESIPGN